MKKYLNDLPVEEIVKRLKDGEYVYYEDTTGFDLVYYRLFEGIMLRYSNGVPTGIGGTFHVSNRYYFKDDDKIESLGTYKTRSGFKAYVTLIAHNIAHGAVEGCGKHITWYLDGSRYTGKEDCYDIILGE